MKPTAWQPIFLKLILIVFTLNVTVAYGACCLDTSQEQSEAAMPCHDTEAKVSVEDENCCAACFNLPPSSGLHLISEHTHHDSSAPQTFYHINTLDPPFRPPIQHLS